MNDDERSCIIWSRQTESMLKTTLETLLDKMFSIAINHFYSLSFFDLDRYDSENFLGLKKFDSTKCDILFFLSSCSLFLNPVNYERCITAEGVRL